MIVIEFNNFFKVSIRPLTALRLQLNIDLMKIETISS